ncbi:MAG: glycosyltransferase [Lachnospiraceae bacterium]|nr:glycosyltransferase [Lachnospiraceae bacterium]
MKKRLFFIISSFSMGGGAESLLTTIVNNLDAERYDIGIMEIIHDTVKIEPINNRIKMYPFYVEANDPKRKEKMYYVYHEWDKIIAEFVPQNYDLYISFNYLKPSFLLPPGKKNIAWIHSDVYNLGSEDKYEERMLQNKAFYKADKIVAISDITTQSIYDLFPEHREKIRTIYNGIDIDKVREKSSENTEVCLQKPAILSVGRLETRKNPLRLLNIFEKIYHKNSKVHLYYLGYGDLESDILYIANEKGLTNNVHLLGYYQNPFPIMAQCNVICMFSDYEGFPMSLLEGVALGKPFVSSVIGGSRILANQQKCGRTVENDDEAVNAILDFIEADENVIREECMKSIQRFGLKKYIECLVKLFEEILDK